MRRQSLQTKLTASRFTLPAVILPTSLCWVAGGGSLWVAVLYAVSSYTLIEINNRFGLIRTRTTLYVSLFILFITLFPSLWQSLTGAGVCLLLLLSMGSLFQSYQQFRPMRHLFHSALFLGGASLLSPSVLLLYPLLWMGAYQCQSLNGRSFLASLLGGFTPYWFLLAIAYTSGHIEWFQRPFLELFTFQPIKSNPFGLEMIPGLVLLVLLFVISSIHCFSHSYQDRYQTRSYLAILIEWFGGGLFIALLQPWNLWFICPFLISILCLLGGHFFATTNNRFTNYSFIALGVVSISLLCYNLWMHLFNF